MAGAEVRGRHEPGTDRRHLGGRPPPANGDRARRQRAPGPESVARLPSSRQTRHKGVISKREADETKPASGKRVSDDEYPGDFEAIVSADVREAT
ncbi:hypothetical protein GCM10010306_021860 [Streptomyces umbrinus]|nr:hypothetical protein GCM10010306_021860 [Streptomyces umbrinus]